MILYKYILNFIHHISYYTIFLSEKLIYYTIDYKINFILNSYMTISLVCNLKTTLISHKML